jgi:hypothetical protein
MLIAGARSGGLQLGGGGVEFLFLFLFNSKFQSHCHAQHSDMPNTERLEAVGIGVVVLRVMPHGYVLAILSRSSSHPGLAKWTMVIFIQERVASKKKWTVASIPSWNQFDQ